MFALPSRRHSRGMCTRCCVHILYTQSVCRRGGLRFLRKEALLFSTFMCMFVCLYVCMYVCMYVCFIRFRSAVGLANPAQAETRALLSRAGCWLRFEVQRSGCTWRL